jgi:2-dehydro-3-deoxygalactonokinase
MGWAEGFIAVDWGTTNRRAYLIGADGRCTDEMEDESGILSVRAGGFPDAVAQIRARLGDLPLLMGGMIGSNRGWIEAPYVPCPAGLDDLAGRLVWAEEESAAIVPGLSYLGDERADVMRGEEVQILGAVEAGLVPSDSFICHPGTHNKWIEVRGGRILSFRTVMTGEMFSLLKEHSILADLLAMPMGPDAAFREGVRRGLSHEGLTAELFSVRARVLLGQAPREQAASYTSGLLIGTDLRVGLRGAPSGEVIVMGRPELTALYAAALPEAGFEGREVDGEEAFLAGARAIAERLQ